MSVPILSLLLGGLAGAALVARAAAAGLGPPPEVIAAALAGFIALCAAATRRVGHRTPGGARWR